MKSKAKGTVPDFFVSRDREFTIAFGIYVDEELGVVPFAGATRKNPTDHENRGRGERLAVGNAFRHLGRSLLKAEYDAIHTQYHTSPKKKKTVEASNCGCEDTDYEPEVYCPKKAIPKAVQEAYEIGFQDGYDLLLERGRIKDEVK